MTPQFVLAVLLLFFSATSLGWLAGAIPWFVPITLLIVIISVTAYYIITIGKDVPNLLDDDY